MKRKYTASLVLLVCVFVVVLPGCGGIGQRSYDSYKSLEAALDGNFLLPDYFAYGLSPDNPDVSFSGSSFVKVKQEKVIDYGFLLGNEADRLTLVIGTYPVSFSGEEGEIIEKVKKRNVSFYYSYGRDKYHPEKYSLDAYFEYWGPKYKVTISRDPITLEESEEFKEQDMEEIIKVIESMLP